MPPPSDVSVFDDVLIDAFYDEGSIERGRGYAEEDRVALLDSRPGSLKAVCLGSGRASYLVQLQWNTINGITELEDVCSCPIGGGCKHCVAVILTARREAAGSASAASGERESAEWRRALSELSTDADGAPEAAEASALALRFALTHPRPSPYSSDTGPRVTMQPVRRGRSGKWVKKGASWREIGSPYGYGVGTGDLDPLHRAAVRAIMTSGRLDQHYTNTHDVPVSLFGPDLWYLLERALEVGVVLIGVGDDEAVALSPTPALARIDLTAGRAGGVTISTGFTVNGDLLATDGAEAGLVGTPAHGLWVNRDDHLTLFPLAAPLHPAVAKLAVAQRIDVPASDVDELLDVYQPALARHAAVQSSDDSVTITTNRFDGLALVVDRIALDKASLHWFARYRRGTRITDYPLRQSTGRYRDRAAESVVVDTLELPTHLLPFLEDNEGRPQDHVISGPDAITLFADVLPQLDSHPDVDVEIRGDQPALRESSEDPLISLTVRDGDGKGAKDGTDWFDLGIEVSVEGELVDFTTLFTALNRDETTLILPSGVWLRLDRPELTRLRELINEARGLMDPTGSGVASVNRFQSSWWEELAGLGVVAKQSERWTDSVTQMGELTSPEPIMPPPNLDATLRHYQQDGLDWLAFLHRNQLGGILADDMGLGKTVQTLALCLHILENDPDARFLVVAPTSVVENWAREAARFAPDLHVRTIRETKARRGTALDEEIAGANLVVTSYALFRLEFDGYSHHDWELLLLDEAQFVKNHQGKTYQCARRLDAATKIAITGTPIENTLMDLWALLSITAPGLYPDPKRFDNTYRKPIESGDAPELLTTLRNRIAPLMRRRTKDAVLTELPPKTEQIVEIDLSARHPRIYQTQLQRQRQKVLGLVGDVQKHRFEIFKSLTLLRQLALDPGLIDAEHDDIGSAKIDRLLDDLTQIVAEGHRALVFSQFTRYLARVRTRLDDAGIAHAYLDGRTRNREKAISRFKDGDAPVFVISLKAGGVGLNLTEADYCFVLDPWWNPATETQAVDRAHRMGQQNPVMVYRYVSTGTIEEKVMELKARKADLFSSVLDADGALAGALTENDIRGLLDLT